MSQLHIGMNQCFTLENLSFPCLGANKMDLLHVTNYIISLLPFGKKNLFQHDMLLTYEHVLFNQALCGYVDIV
jgi:hypothetical protein